MVNWSVTSFRLKGLLTLILRRQITIIEVGPRDGLQYEKVVLPTNIKIELINRLSNTGLSRIECGSFVNPKLLPQMSDSYEVITGIKRFKEIRYSALVPNIKGVENAIACDINEIAIFGAASEEFSRKNINCSIEDSFRRFEDIMVLAKKKSLLVRGYISCIVACPYSGPTDPLLVAELTNRMLEMGCFEVSLGDTIGVATPDGICRVLKCLEKKLNQLALHCHNTNGRAIDNINCGIDMGVKMIDSSIGGLGGCPFAGPGASGNVSTEDVVKLLEQRQLLSSNINVNKIKETAIWIKDILSKHKVMGKSD